MSASEKELIRVEDLHKSFGSLQVLKGVTEHVDHGEVVSVIGPSGGGKSTFLRCLNLLETPTSGKIYFEGKEFAWNNWGDVLTSAAGTDVWTVYTDQFYKGAASVIHHKLGKGTVTYIGTDTDDGKPDEAEVLIGSARLEPAGVVVWKEK